MDEFIFDLGFCDCHQVSSSSFCVLIVETLDIGGFHCSDSPIKSIQKRPIFYQDMYIMNDFLPSMKKYK